MEIIAQVIGMTIAGVILLCLIWNVSRYLFSICTFGDNNKKLLENMKTFDKNKKWD